MPEASTFITWAEAMTEQSYYAILRVKKDATTKQIKDAFYTLALRCHPDRYVEEEEEVQRAASEVFKRGVEAYNVLSKAESRTRYDKTLAQGRLRMNDTNTASVPPPPPAMKTIESLCRTERAKKFGAKADRNLAMNKLNEARIELINAMNDDMGNPALQERLEIIYEAIALEPD
jgi:curved DNA-binding protein CbpA